MGSNIGNRSQFLERAVNLLDETNGITVSRVSSIYETDPVGFEDQAQFLNIAVEVKTDKSAKDLLKRCLQIEEELGRERLFKWGPRVIDVDLLLYNEEVIETEILQVPHPRMYERAFVLVPLMEIAPELTNVYTKESLSSILKQLPDKDGVYQWEAEMKDN